MVSRQRTPLIAGRSCEARLSEANSLGVIAGTRACHQVRPVDGRNLDPAPTTIARRVRWFVSEAVDLAEIIDYLFVHTIEVRYLACVVIRTATLLGQQVKRTTRILVLVLHEAA